MKTVFAALAAAAMLCTLCARGADASGSDVQAAAAREKVCAFLKDAKVYYIATVEQDQPRVRPFGTVNLFHDRLYIQTGRKKKVAQQILANPKVELCAFNGQVWLRLSGTLKEDPSLQAQESMLQAYPSLRKMYQPGDGNNMVLYFENATAVFASFGAPEETVCF